MSHTPGPWKRDAGGRRDLIEGSAGIFEANARLIAAAPDLLEALVNLYKAVGESGWNNATPTLSGKNARSLLLNNARAAIAKAEAA